MNKEERERIESYKTISGIVVVLAQLHTRSKQTLNFLRLNLNKGMMSCNGFCLIGEKHSIPSLILSVRYGLRLFLYFICKIIKNLKV